MWSVIDLLVYGMIASTVLAADPKISIKQTFPLTKYEKGYQTITVHKDSDCLISCVVSNKPKDKKAQWMFQDLQSGTLVPIATDTNTQNAFKYNIDKPAANNWRLKIRNVQESDQGIYTCRIQLHGFSNAFGLRFIKVIEIPRISDMETSSDMVVTEGEKVELRCGAIGIPTPVISWQLVSGGTLPTGGREYTSPVILINSVTREQRGMYKCVALNEAGKDERIVRVTVRYQPRVTSQTPIVYQAVGHSRQLTCEAFGNPLPTKAQITWFKNGGLLQDETKYTHESFDGSNSVLIKLRIHAINDGDFGQYRCYVENSEGMGEHFVELKRSDTPVAEYRRSSKASQTQTYLDVVILCLLLTGISRLLKYI